MRPPYPNQYRLPDLTTPGTQAVVSTFDLQPRNANQQNPTDVHNSHHLGELPPAQVDNPSAPQPKYNAASLAPVDSESRFGLAVQKAKALGTIALSELKRAGRRLSPSRTEVIGSAAAGSILASYDTDLLILAGGLTVVWKFGSLVANTALDLLVDKKLPTPRQTETPRHRYPKPRTPHNEDRAPSQENALYARYWLDA